MPTSPNCTQVYDDFNVENAVSRYNHYACILRKKLLNLVSTGVGDDGCQDCSPPHAEAGAAPYCLWFGNDPSTSPVLRLTPAGAAVARQWCGQSKWTDAQKREWVRLIHLPDVVNPYGHWVPEDERRILTTKLAVAIAALDALTKDMGFNLRPGESAPTHNPLNVTWATTTTNIQLRGFGDDAPIVVTQDHVDRAQREMAASGGGGGTALAVGLVAAVGLGAFFVMRNRKVQAPRPPTSLAMRKRLGPGPADRTRFAAVDIEAAERRSARELESRGFKKVSSIQARTKRGVRDGCIHFPRTDTYFCGPTVRF